ncbi:protein-tyrosine kinase 6 [Pelobates fuscus]|uniref:protein-tyrosine kinase 6 n=1 Tax=Pelobates fuscus TaxID=191477 RepID=UPI002FE499D0
MDGYVEMNQNSKIYVSLWDFQSSAPQEMSFKAGDRFHVLKKTGDWWSAVKLDAQGRRVGKKGYVPHNYVAEEGTEEQQPWFFGDLSRTEAVNLLMKEGNQTGSFLVRISDKNEFFYALSVRSQDAVKHFRILQNNQEEYYLNCVTTFPALHQLISAYHAKPVSQGLKLTAPCVKHEPQVTDLSLVPLDEWERPKEEFALGRRLGMGNFSEVYEGCWNGRIKVAIKTIKQGVTNREIFMKETSFLKTLHHRNLLSLYAVCSVGDPYYIITELLPRGDLLNYLRGLEHDQASIDGFLDIAMQVADGMRYLEANNCIHRDLAARNILMSQNNICKIADFGMARIIKDELYVSLSKEIPYKWTAPEALAFGRYTTKSDVWSFGILLHEIMSLGMVPYPEIPTGQMLQYLKKGYRMKAPENCSKKIYSIMLECWSENPHKRPTFDELKTKLENSANYELTEVSPKQSKLKGIFNIGMK